MRKSTNWTRIGAQALGGIIAFVILGILVPLLEPIDFWPTLVKVIATLALCAGFALFVAILVMMNADFGYYREMSAEKRFSAADIRDAKRFTIGVIVFFLFVLVPIFVLILVGIWRPDLVFPSDGLFGELLRRGLLG